MPGLLLFGQPAKSPTSPFSLRWAALGWQRDACLEVGVGPWRSQLEFTDSTEQIQCGVKVVLPSLVSSQSPAVASLPFIEDGQEWTQHLVWHSALTVSTLPMDVKGHLCPKESWCGSLQVWWNHHGTYEYWEKHWKTQEPWFLMPKTNR